MNRPIKFRAWDGLMRRMAYETFVGCAGGEDYDVNAAFIEGDTDNRVWMQFTGLLDKNGKEIYEGDVIKGDERQGAWAVEWEPAGYWNCMRVPNMEVIGNIYETPDLLKV